MILEQLQGKWLVLKQALDDAVKDLRTLLPIESTKGGSVYTIKG